MALTMDSGGADTVPIIPPQKGHDHFRVAFSPPTSTQGDLIDHLMYQFPTLRIHKSNQVSIFISEAPAIQNFSQRILGREHWY